MKIEHHRHGGQSPEDERHGEEEPALRVVSAVEASQEAEGVGHDGEVVLGRVYDPADQYESPERTGQKDQIPPEDRGAESSQTKVEKALHEIPQMPHHP